MYARVTQLEIDAVRVDVDSALEAFRSEVQPKLVAEPGYRGVLVLATDEGMGLLVSFWDTKEQADTEGDLYTRILEDFVTLFRAPPGRSRYEVKLVDLPALSGAP